MKAFKFYFCINIFLFSFGHYSSLFYFKPAALNPNNLGSVQVVDMNEPTEDRQ